MPGNTMLGYNVRTPRLWLVALCGLLFAAGSPRAHEHLAVELAGCNESEAILRCATAPTLAFDRAGKLWAVFDHNGTIYVTHAPSAHADFRPPVAVNGTPEPIDANGENRPKIAFGAGREIYLSWTRKIAGGYNGEIRFSRSLDGGISFDPVRTINDDGLVTGHRFETLFVDTHGNVYLAWIDKRDLQGLNDSEREFAGAAIYYTVSQDSGNSFAENRRVAANSCECCRIAAAETPQGDVALFFRQIFDQHVRDHGLAIVGPDGVVKPMRRVTQDDWRIDACPHHGPSMLSAGNGEYHLAWFTGGEQRKGIFYGRYDDNSGTLNRLTEISRAATAGHPFLGLAGDHLLLVWKEFDGQQTNAYLVESGDDGATWGERQLIASTAGGSDHPFLIARDNSSFLSWKTVDDGLRIIKLMGDSATGEH
jgi:hypothetical protein